ncbi:hypothetical protein HFA01_25760 [Halobacillus faecis]|uniref:Uncharacterized protein n=1 Tax=Halobacillus faecis TaxID=360184 RepID=A0A511WT22_9BACI|nr:hypothetical protein HFA01_25760 [Halobacillus faecis]
MLSWVWEKVAPYLQALNLYMPSRKCVYEKTLNKVAERANKNRKI